MLGYQQKQQNYEFIGPYNSSNDDNFHKIKGSNICNLVIFT